MLVINPSLAFALCKENTMNQDHLPNCKVLNPGNTPTAVELHNDARI
jgi:hypothetical protein